MIGKNLLVNLHLTYQILVYDNILGHNLTIDLEYFNNLSSVRFNYFTGAIHNNQSYSRSHPICARKNLIVLE